MYPALAKQEHVRGYVTLKFTIAKDGSVQNIEVVSGHPLLIAAAKDALKQYVYNPVLLNGKPVEAVTQVDIEFALGN